MSQSTTIDGFKYSPYQQAIVDYARERKGSMLINAVAGSAKTTTLVEISRYIPATKAIFLAFNKHIQTHLGDKLPDGFQCRTLNSLGYEAWRKYAGTGVELDKDKVDGIFEALYLQTGKTDWEMTILRGTVCKLVHAAKTCGLVPESDNKKITKSLLDDSLDTWVSLIEKFSLANKIEEVAKGDIRYEQELIEKAIGAAREVLRKNNEELKLIDFSDQLYFPFIFDVPMPKYDTILIDEMQDLNGVQLELIYSCSTAKTIFLGVGDVLQCVYSWRGADHTLMGEFKQRVKATSFDLPICYRCPTSVVDLAQVFNRKILPWELAQAGEVKNLGWDYSPKDLTSKDMIISRFNAVLLAVAADFIRARIPVRFAGREVSNELKAMLRQFQAYSVGQLLSQAKIWSDEKIAYYDARDKTDEANRVRDRFYSLKAIASLAHHTDSPSKLLPLIDTIFLGAEGVMFTTIHKAKGLEADNIYFIDRDKLPYVRANAPDWARQQENNLLYVAITRAKKKLLFIKSPVGFRDAYYPKDQE